MLNGPWMIRTVLIILKTWSTNVCLEKDYLKRIPVLVKFHYVHMNVYTGDGLSMIASKLGTPMLLDSYTTTMCEELWVRNSYARALIKLHVENEFKDCLVVVVLFLDQQCYNQRTIKVDYE